MVEVLGGGIEIEMVGAVVVASGGICDEARDCASNNELKKSLLGVMREAMVSVLNPRLRPVEVTKAARSVEDCGIEGGIAGGPRVAKNGASDGYCVK